MLWIANPNNPTGTFLPWEEIEAFLATVPPQVLVVLDEAYGEYLPQAERCDTAAWLARFPNLLISRTFSKAYGLAGLRVGYGLGSAEVIDLLNRVRHPFNVNAPALAAAEAALSDTDFLARSYALNSAGMANWSPDWPSSTSKPCRRKAISCWPKWRRGTHQHRIAEARRDRASGRQLRPARIPAGVGRTGRAERPLS